MAFNESNETRFRSFAERYVVARAPTFIPGGVSAEDMQTVLLEAKSIYRRIEAMGRGINKEDAALAGAGEGQSTQAITPSQGGNRNLNPPQVYGVGGLCFPDGLGKRDEATRGLPIARQWKKLLGVIK